MNSRANQLQFLRFCAFLLICVFHTGQFQFDWCPSGNGAANAVEFFIVLSGFVSGYSSYKKDISCGIKDIFNYVWRKLRKVYPLYFITMIFTVAYSGIPDLVATHNFEGLTGPLKQLLRCLLLVQSWFPTGYFSFNGVGWFLSTIIFLYICNLPLRALAGKIKKKNKADIWFIGVFIVTSACILLYCYLTRNTNMEYTQYVLPVSRLGEYICGMALGYLAYSMNVKIDLKPTASRVVFSILEILMFYIWIKGMYVTMEPWHYRIWHWFLPNCLLILVFSLGRGILSQVFRFNPLRYLGDISFECFLVHQIVIYLYTKVCGLSVMSKLGNLFSIGFCIVMTVMISSLISNAKLSKSN